MSISHTRIQEIAQLARLDLADDDVAAMASELSRVLEYVAQLDALDLEGVPPMTAPTELVLRNDAEVRTLDRDTVLALAPSQDGTHVLVPRVVGDG